MACFGHGVDDRDLAVLREGADARVIASADDDGVDAEDRCGVSDGLSLAEAPDVRWTRPKVSISNLVYPEPQRHQPDLGPFQFHPFSAAGRHVPGSRPSSRRSTPERTIGRERRSSG